MCARLPDVSKAMVYRHVDLLAAEGVLEVAEERRVRGAVERYFRLRQDRAAIDAEAFRAMSPDDHRRVFSTALAVLVAEFSAYLERVDADPAPTWSATGSTRSGSAAQELEQMIIELRQVIAPRLANQAAPERAQYLLVPSSSPSHSRPPTPRSNNAQFARQLRRVATRKYVVFHVAFEYGTPSASFPGPRGSHRPPLAGKSVREIKDTLGPVGKRTLSAALKDTPASRVDAPPEREGRPPRASP